MWKETTIDLGTVKAQLIQQFTFTWLGEDTIEVIKISPSCGCTVAQFNPNFKTLTGSIRPDKVPIHKQWEKQYVLHKNITIETRINGVLTNFTLGIKGIVKDEL